MLSASAIRSIWSDVTVASPVATLRTKSSANPAFKALSAGLMPWSCARLKIDRKSRLRSMRSAAVVRHASSGRWKGSEIWPVTAHPSEQAPAGRLTGRRSSTVTGWCARSQSHSVISSKQRVRDFDLIGPVKCLFERQGPRVLFGMGMAQAQDHQQGNAGRNFELSGFVADRHPCSNVLGPGQDGVLSAEVFVQGRRGRQMRIVAPWGVLCHGERNVKTA